MNNNQTRCVAHEIRNQISICELYSQIIKKNLEKSKIENKSIDTALLCINKALKIIGNNLIELKALGNVNLQVYNLNQILKTGIDMSLVYVQDKDIKISVNCPEFINVNVDENKFLACVVNIIKNAIESIKDKGEISVSVKEDTTKAYISFFNDGEMIPKDVQPHLFEEGYTTKITGSGLGLPICKENLKLQNGDLRLIDSTTEKTEFEIILPKI